MSEHKVVLTCAVCGSSFQFGPHIYQGHRLHRYGGIMVCNACWQGNCDGWAIHLEPLLLAHLNQNGLPMPPRGANCLLPRE